MLIFDDRAKYVSLSPFCKNNPNLDCLRRHDSYRSQVLRALFPDRNVTQAYVDWYKSKTSELLKKHSYQISGIPGTRIDIARNVVNLVGVYWASNYLIGAPLKTTESPAGLFTEQQMYDILMLLNTFVFINASPERGWFLKDQAQTYGDKLNELIEKSIEAAAPKTTVCILSLPRSVNAHIRCRVLCRTLQPRWRALSFLRMRRHATPSCEDFLI